MSDRDPQVSIRLDDLQHIYYLLDALASGHDNAEVTLAYCQVFRTLRAVPALTLLRDHPDPSARQDRNWVERNPLVPERDPDFEPHPDVAPRIVTDVVYGEFARFEGFVFLDAATAEAIARETSLIEGSATLGELREVYPDLQHVHCPLDPAEDDWPYRSDDTPIDLSSYESWPPFPPYYSTAALPGAVIEDLNERDCADWTFPTFDGEFMVVPVGREQDMLAVLAQHGITARRDDELISALGE